MASGLQYCFGETDTTDSDGEDEGDLTENTDDGGGRGGSLNESTDTCHYSCLTCDGIGAQDCTSCDGDNYRLFEENEEVETAKEYPLFSLPVSFTFVNTIISTAWYMGDDVLLGALGVPGYAPENPY